MSKASKILESMKKLKSNESKEGQWWIWQNDNYGGKITDGPFDDKTKAMKRVADNGDKGVIKFGYKDQNSELIELKEPD